jgi:hypothetical protein
MVKISSVLLRVKGKFIPGLVASVRISSVLLTSFDCGNFVIRAQGNLFEGWENILGAGNVPKEYY